MPRHPRAGSAGHIFHVLNRGVRRSRLFDTDADFGDFERLIAKTRARVPVRLHAFILMHNHFHFVVWPHEEGQLSEFMRLLTSAHACRRHTQMGTRGTGAIYQGRFKSFPIQGDAHFLRVCRYVERNALRAGRCRRAEDWRWSSLWHHCRNSNLLAMDPWPIQRPVDWLEEINRGEVEDLEGLRASIRTGRAYAGDE